MALLNQSLPALPLLQLSEEADPYLPKGITGNLKYLVTYRQLLSVIREAENATKSIPSSESTPTLIGTSPQLKQIQSYTLAGEGYWW